MRLLRWMLIGFCLGPYVYVLGAPSKRDSHAAPDAVTIVDVAPGVAPRDVGALVRLAPGERVTSVGDREVAGTLAAGTAIGVAVQRGRQFVDLTVEDDAGSRRVLLLLH